MVAWLRGRLAERHGQQRRTRVGEVKCQRLVGHEWVCDGWQRG